MKTTTKFGIFASVLWVAGWSAYSCAMKSSLIGMEPNALGDFMAGISAPLALFWLVLGYFQQGHELRQNTEALHAQQKQLSLQVQETAALVRASTLQAEAADKMAQAAIDQNIRQESILLSESKPIFRLTSADGPPHSRVMRVENIGGVVSDLKVKSLDKSQDIHITVEPYVIFAPGDKGRITYQQATRYPFEFEISYTNRLGKRETQIFMLEGEYTLKQIG